MFGEKDGERLATKTPAWNRTGDVADHDYCLQHLGHQGATKINVDVISHISLQVMCLMSDLQEHKMCYQKSQLYVAVFKDIGCCFLYRS